MTSTFTPNSAWKTPGSFWRVSAIMPCLIAALASLGFTLTPLRAAAPDSKPGGVTITGQVSNAATKNFLQGAVVALEGTDQMVVTDFEGRYQLRGVTATSPILQVSYSGLDPTRVPVVLQADVTVRNIELTSSIYTLDPFTVTGAREGVAKAQVLQREAPNVKNVIASDAFGSVADGNIADMLTYVTGIVGEYNDTDNRAVSIRGADSTLNNVTMDGQVMAQSSGTTTRRFEFDQQSLGNIDSIEITKAPTPDMEGASIGGTINLVTKSAFTRDAGRQFDFSFGFQTQPNIRLPAASWKAPIPGYGLSASFSYSDRIGEKRNIGLSVNGTFNDSQLNSFVGKGVWGIREDPGPVYQSSATNELKNQERTKAGVGVKIDYRLGENSTLSLSTQYNLANSAGIGLLHNVVATRTLATIDANGNRTGGGPIDPRSNIDGITRVFPDRTSAVNLTASGSERIARTFVFQPMVRHRLNSYDINYSASYSNSAGYNLRSRKDYGTVTASLANVGYYIDRTRDAYFSTYVQTAGPSMYDLNNYTAFTINQTDPHIDDVVLAAKFDVKKDFSTRFPFYLKTGVAYKKQSRDFWQTYNTYNYAGPDGILGSADDSANLAQFVARDQDYLTDKEYLKVYRTAQGTVPFPDPYGVAKSVRTNPAIWKENVATGAQNRLLYDRAVTEAILGGYFMGNIRIQRLSLLTGIRWEQTRVEGEGPVTYLSPAEVARRAAWVGVVTDAEALRRAQAQYGNRARNQGRYQSVFPGAHLKYEPMRNLLARASWSTGVGRPPFGSIIPLNTVNDTTQTVTQNNPALKPQYANSYDAGLAYYFKPQGMISVGWFKKRIRDYIYTDTSGIIASGADNGYNGDYAGYRLSTQSNRGSAIIEGREYSYEQQLSFLPGWARGFGIHANYTTIETAGKFGGTTQLNSSAPAAGSGVPGFSPKASSMGLSYRGFGWDLRLMSVYRGERLYRAATSTGLLSYAGSTTLWSFKGKYALTNRYGLFLNVDNFTSAPISNMYFTYPERTDYYGKVAPVIVGGITGRF